MRKTLLFFLLLTYKLSFCSATACFWCLRNYANNSDLLISEVLFNPKTGGADFVEIYNPTSGALSLSAVAIASIDSIGEIGNIKNLGSGTISGGDYRVISVSSSKIKANYTCPYPDRFIELSSMPAYNNTSGHVVLLRSGEVLDRLDYTEEMHNPLLNIVKGVSLERVSFDKPANAPGNFISAAASVGFATPGYANSVEENMGLERDAVTLSAKVFSPDGDGKDDVLNISWLLKHYGNMATITIYSDQGRVIRRLLKNESVATGGSMSWDGLNDKGQLAGYGIYVAVFSSFDLKGNHVNLKKAFALVGKL